MTGTYLMIGGSQHGKTSTVLYGRGIILGKLPPVDMAPLYSETPEPPKRVEFENYKIQHVSILDCEALVLEGLDDATIRTLLFPDKPKPLSEVQLAMLFVLNREPICRWTDGIWRPMSIRGDPRAPHFQHSDMQILKARGFAEMMPIGAIVTDKGRQFLEAQHLTTGSEPDYRTGIQKDGTDGQDRTADRRAL